MSKSRYSIPHLWESSFALGNQDVDTSFLTLEMTWFGMRDERIQKQIGVRHPDSFEEVIRESTINTYVHKIDIDHFIKQSVKKLFSDTKLLPYLVSQTEKTSKQLRNFSVKLYDRTSRYSLPEIGDILVEIRRLQSECVVFGTVIAWADVHGGISDRLVKVVSKRKLLKFPLHLYTNILGQPMTRSLTSAAYADMIKNKDLGSTYFQHKYFWLDQGYIGTGLQRQQFLKIVRQRQAKIARVSQKALLSELQLTRAEKTYFDISQKLVYCKTLRADSRQFGYVLVNRLVKEVSARTKLPKNVLDACTAEELATFLRGGELPDDVYERTTHCVYILEANLYRVLTGVDAQYFLKKVVEKNNVLRSSKVEGQVAFPGKVTGVVKLVFGPQHVAKIAKGDILISTATSPQLLSAMYKAAAFITDVGGITSHASIVARELKKPCIVGTKVATKVFKDGDVVEVDATKGIIKKNMKKNKYVWRRFWARKFSPLLSSAFMEMFRERPGLNMAKNKLFVPEGNLHAIYFEEKEINKIIQNYSRMLLGSDMRQYAIWYEQEFKNFLEWSQEQTKRDFSNYTNKQLSLKIQKLFSKLVYFSELQFYAFLVLEGIAKEVEDGMRDDPSALRWITTPYKHTQITKARIALLKLKKSKNIKDVDIRKYLRDYGWISVYDFGDNSLSYENIIKDIKLIRDANTELNSIEKVQHEGLAAYKKFLQNVTDLELKKKIEITHYFSYLKEMRDDYRRHAYFLWRPFLDEISKRLNFSIEETTSLLPKELIAGLTGKKDYRSIARARINLYAHWYKEGKLHTFSGNSVRIAARQIQEVGQEEALSGFVAQGGKVTGKVCIVYHYKEFYKFKKGDILVTTMTHPEFLGVMKQAKALVTDEGGITCHAAIVARELKKPCIIGTKVATKVLHDGDTVEVDANKGVVKILTHAKT